LNQTSAVKGTRSFYLIAHRCNDISHINKAFRQKVNGIECDLWADEDKKWWVSHEGISKTDLIQWLTYIAKAEKRFKCQLAVIVFDIKSAEPITGLRDIINNHLPPGLPHIYSVANLDKAHIFAEIVPLLTSLEAIAVDEEDDPTEVAAFFKKIGALQCWYGNGITLVPLDGQFHDSMQHAARLRNSAAPFSKIYTWSIHRKESLRKYIVEDKVDGVIVGLNGFFTRPVSNALKIIRANEEVQLADRSSPLF
jgi:hypothetical protein